MNNFLFQFRCRYGMFWKKTLPPLPSKTQVLCGLTAYLLYWSVSTTTASVQYKEDTNKAEQTLLVCLNNGIVGYTVEKPWVRTYHKCSIEDLEIKDSDPTWVSEGKQVRSVKE